MDQSLVHTFSWANSYGPMVLKVLPKFPSTLMLVHGWHEKFSFPHIFSELLSKIGVVPARQINYFRVQLRSAGVLP